MIHNSVIWIIGATGGLGRELSSQLAAGSNTLILSGRDELKLNALGDELLLKGAKIEVLPFDIGSEEPIHKAVEHIRNKYKIINLLIHCAGIGQRALFHEAKIESEKTIMNINFFAPVLLTKLILPSMATDGTGGIVVVSSVSGLYGFPLRSAYCASKHALNGYFEAARAELYRHNIFITIVCPGRISTDFSTKALTSNGASYNKTDQHGYKVLNAPGVARKMIRAISRKKPMVILGRNEKLLYYIKRIAPILFRYIIRKVSQL